MSKPHFLLSHSKRMVWQQCHLKHFYQQELRMVPRVTAEPLVMGSVGHSAWDLYRIKGYQASADYIQRCGQLDMIDTLKHYHQHEVHLPVQYELFEYRTAFKIKFYEDHRHEVFYVGELDGLARLTRPAIPGDWVLERKFTRQMPSNITKRFLLDDQGHGYLVARMWQAWQSGGKIELPIGLIVEVMRNTSNPMTMREIFPLSSMPYGCDPADFAQRFESELVEVYDEMIQAKYRSSYPPSRHSCHAMGECWYYKMCAEPNIRTNPTLFGYVVQERSHEEDVVGRITENGKPDAS